jgi:hypothetical protein
VNDSFVSFFFSFLFFVCTFVKFMYPTLYVNRSWIGFLSGGHDMKVVIFNMLILLIMFFYCASLNNNKKRSNGKKKKVQLFAIGL